jgi:hypothetical protein
LSTSSILHTLSGTTHLLIHLHKDSAKKVTQVVSASHSHAAYVLEEHPENVVCIEILSIEVSLILIPLSVLLL